MRSLECAGSACYLATISYPDRIAHIHDQFFLQDFFGLARPVPTAEALRNAKAALIIAGSDGLSERELDYALSLFRGYGAPQDVLDELRNFDHASAELDDYLVPGGAAPPRVLLYHAIRISRADGIYGESERRTIERGARMLGIDSAALTAIESIVDLEDALRKTRIALLYP